MGKAAKITISLPGEMLAVVEQERRALKESRSEFFRHVIEQYLRQKRRQENIHRYVQGYQQHPESPEEIAAYGEISKMVLALEPWE